jgi:hypothetical protein
VRYFVSADSCVCAQVFRYLWIPMIPLQVLSAVGLVNITKVWDCQKRPVDGDSINVSVFKQSRYSVMAKVCWALCSTELDTRIYQVGSRPAAVFILDIAHIFRLCICVLLHLTRHLKYMKISYRNKMAEKHAITHPSYV